MGETNRFYENLLREIVNACDHFYSKDNCDTERFDPPQNRLKWKFVSFIKSFLFRHRLYVIPNRKEKTEALIAEVNRYSEGLNNFFRLLQNDLSRMLLVKLIAFRLLGYSRIKLPTNSIDYWKKKQEAMGLIKGKVTIPIDYRNWRLHYYELSPIGFPLCLFLTSNQILQIFLLKQYEYNRLADPIKVSYGDTVCDAGGCWGDTALYFANECGKAGKVFSFEFIPSNLNIFHQNLSLNPEINSRIHITDQPLWSKSGLPVEMVDRGPASVVQIDTDTSDADRHLESISLDDFIKNNNILKLDYIKMDIEGSELQALRGAEGVIREFRPKLAISLYHRLEDFVAIPEYINSLQLGYCFYLDHFSIHSEETVLFAVSSIEKKQ